MRNQATIETLERRYARALGNYETAAQVQEVVVGRKALELSAARVVERRKRYLDVMEETAAKIRQRYVPDWTAGHIKPIYFRQGKKPTGQISRLAYATLRTADQPLTSSEVARIVAVEIGVDPSDHRALAKISSSVQNTFQARFNEGVVVRLDGPPMRWTRVPVPERRLSAAARNLSIRPTPGAALPPPRPFETVDRC
jgi:hypothetical protein